MSERTHLELMSKARLVALVRDTRAAATEARKEARDSLVRAEFWRAYADDVARTAEDIARNPAVEWQNARRLLANLPTDPDADDHRRDLLAALKENLR